MIKSLVSILLAGILSTAHAHAVNLLQGSREVGVSGLIDFDGGAGTLIALDASYGFFWADFVESGLHGGVMDNDVVSTWRLGLFTEYNFFRNTALVPYLGGSLDLLGTQLEVADGSSDEFAGSIGLDLGVKYFITDSVAVSTQLGLDVATADVYPAEDGAEDVNWDLTLGMRFFF